MVLGAGGGVRRWVMGPQAVYRQQLGMDSSGIASMADLPWCLRAQLLAEP